MLPHQLSCPIGGLFLSVLMLKDANPNHYPVPGVECVVSHESRQFTDMGTKSSWATLATLWGSLTPSYRRTATYIALAHLLREGGADGSRLTS